MHTSEQQKPGPYQPATVPLDSTGGKSEQISLPHTDRQDGPFKHSGEVSRQTPTEEAEMEEKQEEKS